MLDGHNVVSECMVPTSETTIGIPYICARTVSSLAKTDHIRPTRTVRRCDARAGPS